LADALNPSGGLCARAQIQHLSAPLGYLQALSLRALPREASSASRARHPRYKPYKTTDCKVVDESAFGGPKGSVCGFVIFPCSDENGCKEVLNGAW
jgi:hypothetical protein